MPRLLVVSPHFPPINAPDMQRVRMSLPRFVEAGWEVTVLAADDPTPLAPAEPDLLRTIPPEVKVIRVRPYSRQWTRIFGCHTLGLRILRRLRTAGDRLLRSEHHDLVFFSTTQFIVFPLGVRWLQRFGVPYVLDFQDPWRSDYYSRPGAPKPPGGWKYRFAAMVARRGEGEALRHAAHVISVSPKYLEAFASRYPWWDPSRGRVIEFGAPLSDLETAREIARTASPLLPRTSSFKLVYAGRLGPDMRPALTLLIRALAEIHGDARSVELFLFGTSYAPKKRAVPTAMPIAREIGVADQVHERPERIGYLDSLRLLLEADAVLLLGSDDPAYSPSKVYPALATGRSVLAIAPEGSVLQQKLAETGGATTVAFSPDTGPDSIAEIARHLREYASESHAAAPFDRDSFLSRFSANAVADRQLECFRQALSPNQGSGFRRRIKPASVQPTDKT